MSQTSNQPSPPAARWIPLADWPHSWPTHGALRQMINGRLRAGEVLPWVRYVGTRLLVNPDAFQAWIDEQPPAKPPARRRPAAKSTRSRAA